MREARIKILALKKTYREKEGGRGEKNEPGKGEGLRNSTLARWLLRPGRDFVGNWNREESILETSGDKTRDSAASEKPTWNFLSKTERKTRGSIRVKNVERSKNGMKLPCAAQNRNMVLPYSSPGRISMVKIPRVVQNRDIVPPSGLPNRLSMENLLCEGR